MNERTRASTLLAASISLLERRYKASLSRVSPVQWQPKAWPVVSGIVPSLAEGCIRRPETVRGPWDALHPGLTVILGPERDPAAAAVCSGGTGKTQLAVAFARKVWASAGLDLLVWLDASSRDSIITGYAQALADVRVAAPPGKPEAAASQFLTWLADTARRWLVVLDGLTESADAEGLWPQGPAGQALITTSLTGLNPSPAGPGIMRATQELSIAVGSFSQREAIKYLSGRLKNDPYQASGALDLAIAMDLKPSALALAVAYMLDSGQDCSQYRVAYEKYRRNRAEGMASDPLAPAWMLAVDRASQFGPGELAWPALKLAAVLSPAWIPGAVLTSDAACAYLTGRQAVSRSDRASARAAFRNLQRLGLVTIQPEDQIRTLRMPAALQSSLRQAMSPAELRQSVQAAADALCQAWPDSETQAEMQQALRDCATSIRRCDDRTLWNPDCQTVVPGLMPGLALQPAGTALGTDPGGRTAVRTGIQASEAAAHAAPLQGPGNGTSGASLQHMVERAVRQGTAATRSSAPSASSARGRDGKVLVSLLVGAIVAGAGAFLISTSTTPGAGQQAVGQGRSGLGSRGAAPQQLVRNTFNGGVNGWEQITGEITLKLVSQPAIGDGGSLLLTASGPGTSVAGTATKVAQLRPGDTVTFHVWSSGQPGSIRPLVNSDSNHYAYAPARELPSTAGWFTLTWEVPPTSTVEGIGLQVVNPGNGSLTLALGDLSWP